MDAACSVTSTFSRVTGKGLKATSCKPALRGFTLSYQFSSLFGPPICSSREPMCIFTLGSTCGCGCFAPMGVKRRCDRWGKQLCLLFRELFPLVSCCSHHSCSQTCPLKLSAILEAVFTSATGFSVCSGS